MQDFSIFDIIIIAITLALGLKGLFKGFIKEVFGLVGIIGGIFVASRFADVVGMPIAKTLVITNEATISLIGFVVTLILFWAFIYILGTVISKIFSLSGLGFIDRLFGFIFGSAKIFLILAVISHSLYQIESFKDKLDTKFSTSLVFPLLLKTGSYIVKLDTKKITESIEKNIEVVIPTKETVKEKIEDVKTAVENVSKKVVEEELTKKLDELTK